VTESALGRTSSEVGNVGISEKPGGHAFLTPKDIATESSEIAAESSSRLDLLFG
jgi:hypothetical protein